MKKSVSIPRGPWELAADLYRPDDADPVEPLPAVVLATPGSSVKEQIGANYARRLAERGFVALAFDPSHQGASGGEPRDLEDPYRRSDDISDALDWLVAQPGVDPRRVGMLGICAGGGYAVFTARTDHRIRAVSTVVPGNMGTSFRAFQAGGPAAGLDAIADARLRENLDGGLERVGWLPDTPEEAEVIGLTDIDNREAVRYYRTARGGHERSTNRRVARGDALLVGFDAFHLVEELLTQPLQVIVAGRRGITRSYEMGLELWDRAPNPVDLFVVDGAGHYEMYDEPAYVDAAVERIAAFFGETLHAGVQPADAARR
jgi:uncharacterized protein